MIPCQKCDGLTAINADFIKKKSVQLDWRLRTLGVRRQVLDSSPVANEYRVFIKCTECGHESGNLLNPELSGFEQHGEEIAAIRSQLKVIRRGQATASNAFKET